MARMDLQGFLSEKRHLVLERWLNLIFESYPPETAKFLKREKDRFANPVAYEFQEGIKGIYEALLYGMEPDRVAYFLDRIISIRAIQDFLPSGALTFIFLLKTAIRKELEKEIREKGVPEELLELESRIDGLALLCFDVYMRRREKLYELRVDEVKRRVSGLLRMAGLVVDLDQKNNKEVKINGF